MKKLALLFVFLFLPFIALSQSPDDGGMDDYYNSITDWNISSAALKSTLNSLISTGHNPLPYSSASEDTWDVLQISDLISGTDNVLLMYGYDDSDGDSSTDRTRSKNSMATSGCTGLWNREHVFAKSLATPALETTSAGSGTDLHNLRAIDCQMNSTRNNNVFEDSSGNAALTSNGFYPGDEFRGDVARIIMYMYIRYPTQAAPNDIAYSNNTYHSDMPDVFLEWNQEDPPSDIEKLRNSTFETKQGNRNPFIDNPYIAQLIWGGPTVTDWWNLASPRITFNSASSVNETNADASTDISVTMSSYSAPVTISISIDGSSTAENGDYTLNTSSLTFNGNGSQNISVTVKNDDDNHNETIILNVSVSSGSANLVNSQHTVSISDDEKQLIITEIADPNGSGSSGKRFVEIFNSSDRSVDLSDYKIKRWVGGGTSTGETTLSGTLASNEYYIVANSSSTFLSVYGFTPNQATSNVVSSNGDDSYGIILVSDSSIVDLYGDVSVDGDGDYADGTGTSWEFEDGRAERKASSTIPSSSWVSGDWNVENDTGGGGSTNNPQTAPDDYDPGYWIGATTTDTWTGRSNTSWATATNWSSGVVPASGDKIFIHDANNDPDISSADIEITDLTVKTGGVLDIEASGSLKLSGNFSNSGTVTLNSSGALFSSLIVVGTSTGNITYNRYVNSIGADEWDLIGSPVSGQDINSFATTNSSSLASGGGSGSNQYAIGQFDNSESSAAAAWTNFTTSTIGAAGDFSSGQGYQMATSSGATLAFTGTISTADVTRSIVDNSASLGYRWNLVANPYPSYLNLNSAAHGTNNLISVNTATGNQIIDGSFAAVYGWNPNKSGGAGYDSYDNNDTAKYIAPGQGFFIAASSSSSIDLDFTEAMQTVDGGDDFVVGDVMENTEIYLRLYNSDAFIEQAHIRFRENMTLGLNPGYDVGNFNQNAAITTRLLENDDGINFEHQNLPLDAIENAVIPLVIYQSAGQEFRINLHTATIPDPNVYLEDVEEGTFTNLYEGDFVYTPTSDLSGAGRFFIHMSADTMSNEGVSTTMLNAFKEIDASYITIEGLATQTNETNVSLYNILGRKVLSTTLNNNMNTQTISTIGLSAGIYVIELESGTDRLTKKLIIK